jgi:uncharacterized membrane protein (DUF485 family)
MAKQKRTKSVGEHVRAHGKLLRTNFLTQVTILMTSAFGFVAALAWNNAIQASFTAIFGASTHISVLFGYAVLVTIVGIIATFYISHISERLNR